MKPRPASPAEAAWIAAFSASTLVCSVMSEISSTISPISCEDSPSRLMRFEVSWICSRISFMPEIEFCTACEPFCAADSDCFATPADCVALSDISFIACAMLSTEALVSRISRDCFSAAASSCTEVFCAASVAFVTCAAALLMRPTTPFSSSMVKFTESAMAPVMSSVTVAFAVRSPSARSAHLVHQPQDRGLVGLVGAFDRGALALGFLGASGGCRRGIP